MNTRGLSRVGVTQTLETIWARFARGGGGVLLPSCPVEEEEEKEEEEEEERERERKRERERERERECVCVRESLRARKCLESLFAIPEVASLQSASVSLLII